MNDYNFFSVYERKKGLDFNIKSPYLVGAILLIICLLVSIGLVGSNFYYSYSIGKLTSEIDGLKASTEFKEATYYLQSIDAMKQYDDAAQTALDKFIASELLGTDYINKITSVIPSNVIIQGMSLDNFNLAISAQIPNRKVASELMLALDETGLFYEVKIIGVFKNTEGVGFATYINATIKESEAKWKI